MDSVRNWVKDWSKKKVDGVMDDRDMLRERRNLDLDGASANLPVASQFFDGAREKNPPLPKKAQAS